MLVAMGALALIGEQHTGSATIVAEAWTTVTTAKGERGVYSCRVTLRDRSQLLGYELRGADPELELRLTRCGPGQSRVGTLLVEARQSGEGSQSLALTPGAYRLEIVAHSCRWRVHLWERRLHEEVAVDALQGRTAVVASLTLLWAGPLGLQPRVR